MNSPQPVYSKSLLLFYTGAELGAGEGLCIGLEGKEGHETRPCAGATLAGGCWPAWARSLRFGKHFEAAEHGPAAVISYVQGNPRRRNKPCRNYRASLFLQCLAGRSVSPSTLRTPRAGRWGQGSCWRRGAFPKDLRNLTTNFLLPTAFSAALGSGRPAKSCSFQLDVPRASLPLALPWLCSPYPCQRCQLWFGPCLGLSLLYPTGCRSSRWKFLLFLFPGNVSRCLCFKGCAAEGASAVTTATSPPQLKHELRGIFHLCSEAFSTFCS